MPIQTTVAPRQTWKLLICAVLCVVFTIWGAYSYWIGIPEAEREAKRYQELKAAFSDFEERNARMPLLQSQLDEWAAVRDEIDAFKGRVPEPPPKWDRPVKLWVYIVLCGVIGLPWTLWALVSLSRRNMRLESDGTLVFKDGRWGPDEVVDIDMNNWMEKSIAVLEHRDGRTLVLDDYKHRNMHLIVGAYAHRFHPELWTPEARQVKPAEKPAVEEPVAETG